jgi:hypothetical protein
VTGFSADFLRRALGVLALAVAVLVARVLYGAHVEEGLAERAAHVNNVEGAIAHHRRTIGWYVPFNPYGPRAIAALERISAEQEARNEQTRALLSARAIHAGIESARGLFVPYASELARADARVATLLGTRAQSSPQSLTSPPDPSPFFSVLAVLSWLGFVASAFSLVTEASDAAGRFSLLARSRVLALLLSAVLFALSLALA